MPPAEGPRSDAVLPEDIQPGPAPRAAAGGAWLITGAAGFLGSSAVVEALRATDGTVYALIRSRPGEDPAAAERRLWDALGSAGLTVDDPSASRVTPLHGDLAAPSLGLTPASFDAVVEETSVIVHAGAEVNMVFSHQTLRGANVDGSSEVLRLAVRARARVLHLSTLSVFAGARETEQLLVPDLAKGIDGYTSTKWAADQRAAQAVERGLPVSVVRTGRLSPHSGTGHANSKDILIQILSVINQLQLAPSREYGLRLLPVDEAATDLVALALAEPDHGQAVSLTGARVLPWEQVLDAAAPGVSVVPLDVWLKKVRALVRTDEKAAPALIACASGHWDTPPDLEMANFERLVGRDPGGHADPVTAGLARWSNGIPRSVPAQNL